MNTTNINKFPFNVYWSISDGSVKVDDMKRLLSAAGFPEDTIPVPTERQNCARCVRSFQNRRGADKTITDAAGETEKSAVYAILSRNAGSANSNVEYGETTRVVYDKDTDTTTATGDLAEAFMQRLADKFRDNYIGDDLRSWVTRLVSESSGIPKRPGGGIYIVPGRFRPVFEQAQKLLSSLNNGSCLFLERVWMGEEEAENIQKSLTEYVNGEIDAIAERAEKYSRQGALNGLTDETKRLDEINALFSEALDIEAFTAEIGERMRSIQDTLTVAIADANSKAAASAAKRSATPLEVAERVATELAAVGRLDINSMALRLKADGFITKTSTVFNRVQKAIEGGFDKLTIEGDEYVLKGAAAALPPPAFEDAAETVTASALPPPPAFDDEEEVAAPPAALPPVVEPEVETASAVPELAFAE